MWYTFSYCICPPNQEMQHLSLIFSGSNRHMLESIFQDDGRPLYKLCKKIKLGRISEAHYRNHLNKAASLMWGSELPLDVFQNIMLLTERHPYYVNYLCDAIWSRNEQLPERSNIHEAWCQLVEEERSDLLTEFYSIADNPKKLMIYIATQPKKNIYTAAASKLMEMPTTSVPKALATLLKKDLIEEFEARRYRVINPVYQAVLSE